MSDTQRNENGLSGVNWGNESLFIQLILSFHAAAWQQMGKVQSVITGKIERDLEMAKHSIDMLGMLETKTKGNLTEDEEKYLRHTLYELRMNYLDETKKGPDGKDNQPSDDQGESSSDQKKNESE